MKPLHGCRLEGPPPVTGGYDGEARFTTIRANLTETFAVHDAHSEFTGEIDRLWVSNVDTASGTRGTAASLLQEEDAHGNDPPFHQPPPPRHSNDVVDGRQGVATTTPGVMTPWPSESDEAMTNREILAEACTKRRLSDLLERYCEEDRPLNKVNLATIFQNIGRLGMPRDCQDKIVAYLDAAWKKMQGRRFKRTSDWVCDFRVCFLDRFISDAPAYGDIDAESDRLSGSHESARHRPRFQGLREYDRFPRGQESPSCTNTKGQKMR